MPYQRSFANGQQTVLPSDIAGKDGSFLRMGSPDSRLHQGERTRSGGDAMSQPLFWLMRCGLCQQRVLGLDLCSIIYYDCGHICKPQFSYL